MIKNLEVYEQVGETSFTLDKDGSKKLTGYASIDRPWLKYYESGADEYDIPAMSMYQLIEEFNKDRMNDTALTYFDIKIKYKKLFECINNYSKSLNRLGVKKNEMVILILPQIPEARELIYASNILGAVVYPITPMLAPKQLDRIISENEVKKVFIFDGFYERYSKMLLTNKNVETIVPLNGTESIPKQILFFKDLIDRIKGKKSGNSKISYNEKIVTWNEFVKLKEEIPELLTPVYEKNSPAAVIGTSGTSGIPSDVVITNENANAMTLQHLAGGLNYSPKDKLMDDLIVSIGYGFSVMHYSTALGLNVALIPTMETDVYNLLSKYKPDHFIGGPIHYENLRKKIEDGNDFPSYGKNFVSGGADFDIDLEKYLNVVDDDYTEEITGEDIFIRQGYGMTENGGAATYSKVGSYKLGSQGIPLPFENMSVFDSETNEELPYNEVGEICVSGPTVMKEYLNKPLETEKVLRKHSDGKIWLHTKDYGYVDEDGHFFITGRIKDVFMRSGHNVHPKAIRNFILNLPFVDDCAVAGIEHPDEQKVPVAFVKLIEGQDIENARKKLELLCIENLDGPLIPYEFIFVENIPHNMGGKIDINYLIDASNIDYFSTSRKQGKTLVKVNQIRFNE